MALNCCSMVNVEGIGPEYRRIADEYSLEGWKRLERHWEYVSKGDNLSVFKLSFLVSAGIISGGVVGAALSGIVPLSIRLVIPGYIEGECAARARNLVGAHFGGLGGGAMGAFLHMYMDETIGGFQDWYLQGLTNDMIGVIRQKYMGDPILCLFESAISKDFMLFPVFSPTGTLYDLPELRGLKKDPAGRVADPLRNPPFNTDDTRPWHELAYLTNKRVIFLIKRDLCIFAAPADKGVREKLEGVLGILKQEAEHCYEKSKGAIEGRRKAALATRQEYMNDLSRFFDAFGDDSNADLNWELPWKEILEDRLLGSSGKEEKTDKKERRNSIPIDRGMLKQT